MEDLLNKFFAVVDEKANDLESFPSGVEMTALRAGGKHENM